MKPLSEQTLYEILEVATDADPSAIAAAYERARSLYGPGSLATYTLMTPEEAALLTSRIEEAKRTLLDADARARYDVSLSAPAAATSPARENGSSIAPFTAVPPVIPALQPVAAEPLPPDAVPADLLRAAADVGRREPAPIRLDREVPPRPPAPATRAVPPPAALPEPEVPLPEDGLWTGPALKKVREARGISVQQIAERTKVTRHHLENIEEERFSLLPAPVYLRGILLSVARELRLDGQKVARAYLERVAGAASGEGPVRRQ